MPIENENMIELDLRQTGRKAVRVDGDDNRILMINTSDLSVISRLKEAESHMSDLVRVAAEKMLNAGDNDAEIASALKEVDEEFRACMDFVFNADVSKNCAPEGTMFDPFNGKYRFEIIMESLADLYGSNFSIEYRKMASRIRSKTSKYTGK